MAMRWCPFWDACSAWRNILVSASSWLVQSSGTSLAVVEPFGATSLVQLSPWVTKKVRSLIFCAYTAFSDHSRTRKLRRLVLFLPFARNFLHWRGHSCWPLVTLTTSCPSLLRLVLSVFFIEMAGCWSPTKSILAASPASVRILDITISASSQNLSGTLTTVCSIAIASMMTAVVWSGKLCRHSTPFSSNARDNLI